MPRPKSEQRRILGPYQDGAEWRIIVVDPTAAKPRSNFTATSKEAIDELAEDIKKQWHVLDEITVSIAIREYRQYLKLKGNRTAQGDKEPETIRRLRLFFTSHDRLVATLTKSEVVGLYETFAATRSADYHRNTLAEVRTFLAWCVTDRGWLRSNPLDGYRSKLGKRKKGKRQLTRDEALRFDAAAEAMTLAGDLGALGAWTCLLMGFRQSEVWKRVVRDVDGSGTILKVLDPKTPSGERDVEIPECLQPHYRKLIEGREGHEPLFRTEHTKAWLRFAVKRVLKKAGLPEDAVTPHGLRGTFTSLAKPTASTAHEVAASLGHKKGETRTMFQHYDASGAAEADARKRALDALRRGSDGPKEVN